MTADATSAKRDDIARDDSGHPIRSDGAGMKSAAQSARAARTEADPFLTPRKRAPSSGSRDSYSRFVGYAKYLLPAIAALMMLVALMWPSFFGGGNEAGKIIEQEIKKAKVRNFEMKNPKYVGTDEKGRPFRLQASKAVQAYRGAEVIELTNPKGTVALEKGNFVVVTAKRGELNQKTKILVLTGDVSVYHDGGYSFKTEKATINLTTKNGWGDQPILASGSRGTIAAQGFRIVDGGDRVIFLGKSRVVMNVSDQDVKSMTGDKPGNKPGDKPGKQPGNDPAKAEPKK
jgi:lipopolysaccharide export system protein LptC